ncbi:MAG: hypothetical protein JSS81_15500 [Acidobacteria bacterium]|nr:hypothetical protein [Acidobacteriota bacterium]
MHRSPAGFLHNKPFDTEVFNLPVSSHRRGSASAIADAADKREFSIFPSRHTGAAVHRLSPTLLTRAQLSPLFRVWSIRDYSLPNCRLSRDHPKAENKYQIFLLFLEK